MKTLKSITADITDVLSDHMSRDEARERANNIAQVAALDGDLAIEDIAGFLRPSSINSGIADRSVRVSAAIDIARLLAIYRSATYLAAWVGIMMLGLDETEARSWLRSKGVEAH